MATSDRNTTTSSAEPTPVAEEPKTVDPQPVEVSPEQQSNAGQPIPEVSQSPVLAKQGEPLDIAGPGLAPVSERAEYQDQSVLVNKN